jgi:hypothetical protein
MDIKQHAQALLDDFNLCIKAKPKHNAVDLQLEKDMVSKWAVHLNNQLGWGTDNEIVEACHQLEPRLEELKKKLTLEILTNGTI